MLDPKEHLEVCGPKKGDCYICGRNLLTRASLQININVPLTKFKRVAGRVCVDCSCELRSLVDLRINQAKSGDYPK